MQRAPSLTTHNTTQAHQCSHNSQRMTYISTGLRPGIYIAIIWVGVMHVHSILSSVRTRESHQSRSLLVKSTLPLVSTGVPFLSVPLPVSLQLPCGGGKPLQSASPEGSHRNGKRGEKKGWRRASWGSSRAWGSYLQGGENYGCRGRGGERGRSGQSCGPE